MVFPFARGSLLRYRDETIQLRGDVAIDRVSEQGMASKGRMFAGCTVALVTPFRDGEVDYPALQRAGRLADRAGDAGPQPGRDDRRVARRCRTTSTSG